MQQLSHVSQGSLASQRGLQEFRKRLQVVPKGSFTGIRLQRTSIRAFPAYSAKVRTRCRAADEKQLEQQQQHQQLDLPFESDAESLTAAAGTVPLKGSLMKPDALESGATLKGRYTIVDTLGAGSNAITYKATDSQTGNQVAIKALSLKCLRDWKQLELFQREAVILEGLTHPNIPKYIDYFEEDTNTDRCFYIVQEVAQGRSLAQMIESGMRADESEVLRIAQELLGVLQYLASLRPAVIHRDIKPENVVLEGGSWGGRVYLIDFGGVQGTVNAGATFSLGSTIVGTYGYMGPEQFRGQATPASDLYALGGTLLFLVSGQPPFAFPQQRMRLEYRSKVEVGPVVGELLDGLLEPLVEDRVTAQEALDIATGQAATRRKTAEIEARKAAAAAAAATAELAQQRRVGVSPYWWAPSPSGQPVRKPAGSRVILTKTPGKLDIEIPPKGLSGDSMGTGLFALAWNAFVAFWTVSALASGGLLFALFSAPFWFAGYQIAGQAFGGALMKERFAIGRNRFRLAQELAVMQGGAAKFLGQGARQSEGQVEDLAGARVITTIIVNGQPQTAIEVVEGVNKYRFGEGLALPEQQWLVYEINKHLTEERGEDVRMDLAPPEDTPKVYDDMDPGVSATDTTDPFWDMRADSRDMDRADPFRDRDQFWRK